MSALRGKWLALLCLLPFAVFFFAFQVAPLLWVAINSLIVGDSWSLANFSKIFSSKFYLQAIKHSLQIAFWSSLFGIVIAILGSYSLRQVDSKLRDFVMAFSNMTSNFAGVPLAFAFIIILGINGAVTLLLKSWGLIDGFNLYSGSGLILIYTYFQIPLALLLLYPAFDALQDEWPQAAALLGASKGQYVWHVALPVLTPALLGTLIILFANAVGAYASAYALTTGNFNLVTIRVASLVSGDIFLEPNMAAALAVILMVLLGVVTAANQWLLKKSYVNKGQSHA